MPQQLIFVIVFQDTIDDVKEKACATNDQLFTFLFGMSVNDRVVEDELNPCQYGHCLLCMLHYIVAACLWFPQVCIFVGKFDWCTAYCHVHLAGSSAAEYITVLDSIALVALFLTYGGTSCPSLQCTISEHCTDLATNLLACSNWDPCELHSNHAHLILSPCFLSDDIPFALAELI